MDLESKEELYDILFNIGQQILNHYDPCEWWDGNCRRMRSSEPDAEVCCKGCAHLGETGCTVKSLACKLWLCGDPSSLSKECVTELKIVRMVADYSGIPYRDRKSKEEDFSSLRSGENSQTRRHR
jgi:hypothetical protein